MLYHLALVVLLCSSALAGKTSVSIVGTQFYINGKVSNPGSPAQGLLLNSRMSQVNKLIRDIDYEINYSYLYRQYLMMKTLKHLSCKFSLFYLLWFSHIMLAGITQILIVGMLPGIQWSL